MAWRGRSSPHLLHSSSMSENTPLSGCRLECKTHDWDVQGCIGMCNGVGGQRRDRGIVGRDDDGVVRVCGVASSNRRDPLLRISDLGDAILLFQQRDTLGDLAA
jgi:hypothetical protein